MSVSSQKSYKNVIIIVSNMFQECQKCIKWMFTYTDLIKKHQVVQNWISSFMKIKFQMNFSLNQQYFNSCFIYATPTTQLNEKISFPRRLPLRCKVYICVIYQEQNPKSTLGSLLTVWSLIACWLDKFSKNDKYVVSNKHVGRILKIWSAKNSILWKVPSW